MHIKMHTSIQNNVAREQGGLTHAIQIFKNPKLQVIENSSDINIMVINYLTYMVYSYSTGIKLLIISIC